MAFVQIIEMRTDRIDEPGAASDLDVVADPS